LIIDGERKKVAVSDILLLADGGDKHDGVGHVDHDRAVGLTRDNARLDRDVVGAVLERSRSSHWIFLANGRGVPPNTERRSAW
jgi:hypothetical protein